MPVIADILAFSLIICAFFVNITLAEETGGNPHLLRQSCTNCHRLDSEARISRSEFTASETILCGKCHRGIMEAPINHPVYIRPKGFVIPSDLPLSKEGLFVCSTCHYVHVKPDADSRDFPHLLRIHETGARFCMVCHQKNGNHGDNSHSLYFRRAHFPAGPLGFDQDTPLDYISRACLSCHDGSFVRFPLVRVADWDGKSRLGGFVRGIHPIGIDYEKSRRLRGGLKLVTLLDRRIRLVQGKVSCISCHDPYSPRAFHLVMENTGSRLCLSCHIK